jgi:serine acetyltransferase
MSLRLLGILFKKTMKRLGSGAPNNYLRVLAFRLAGYQIGCDVWIGVGLVVVDDREGEQTMVIGDRAAIAPRATIILQSYPNNSRIREAAPTRNASVRVGEDAWVGACAILLPGVTVGSASVVGAGSVVTRDVPNDSVFVGNPARCLRSRVDTPGLGQSFLYKSEVKQFSQEGLDEIKIEKAEGGTIA